MKQFNDNPNDGVRFFFILGEYLPLGDVEVPSHKEIFNADVFSYDDVKTLYENLSKKYLDNI